MPSTKEEQQLFRRQLDRAIDLDPIHLNCRVGGDRHHWHLAQPDWRGGVGIMEKCSQCSRCLCIKREEISRTDGAIMKRNYEYPKGFLMKRQEGDGPEKLISPGAVRLAMLSKGLKLQPLKEQ